MDTRPHPYPTIRPQTGTQTRTATLTATVALGTGYVLLVPFWVLTGQAVARDGLVPGSAALFAGGILLVAVNAWLQWPIAAATWRRRRLAAGWVQAGALWLFLTLMTAGNAAILVEMVAVRTRWTHWDTAWTAVAAIAFVGLWQALRRTAVMVEAPKVALALAGRVVIQAGIAVQSIVAGHSEPLPMIVLFAAFGLCRTVPVLVQWRWHRSAPTLALAITEGANLASIGLLGVAWLHAGLL